MTKYQKLYNVKQWLRSILPNISRSIELGVMKINLDDKDIFERCSGAIMDGSFKWGGPAGWIKLS